ncbi:PqqD family protein [Qipengyuania spongiae]|uniref:PqqD family protein n=1 Tax=Qipengyuania spongiae TaxID=2909673 RepID=A0ABY5T187_9SPHN|nr:PqqD family protein [Qipengyuania spongiae]UVI39091.1 PqqD family protein [Qipengyuania spongiae]
MLKFAARPNVVACDLDAGQALLNLETSQYFKLNDTGALIWKNVEAGNTLEQMQEELSSVFDVSQEDCRDDIIDLLKALEEAGLIERQA